MKISKEKLMERKKKLIAVLCPVFENYVTEK